MNFSALITLGILMILSPWTRGLFSRIKLPPLVGYIALGLLVSVLDEQWAFITPDFESVFAALAGIGVVALLFRVGLRSNTKALLAKLPDASIVWIGDVLTNLTLGFVVSFYVLSLSLETSLVIATAFSATSVALSVSAWDQMHAMESPNGQLLVDIAELDDLSGVLLLALLLAILPNLVDGADIGPWTALGWTPIWLLGKLFVFVIGCYLFAHYIESNLTRFNRRWGTEKGLAATMLGAGLAIAATAGFLGFSLAIGALFAGLAFSRDPEAVHEDGHFSYFYELFTPFFFIQIGMQVDPGAVLSSIGLGAALLIPAVLGKFVGVAIPALAAVKPKDAVLLGISMIPRAEIALVIVYQCQLLGANFVPDRVFAALVLITIATSIIAPIALKVFCGTRDTVS